MHQGRADLRRCRIHVIFPFDSPITQDLAIYRYLVLSPLFGVTPRTAPASGRLALPWPPASAGHTDRQPDGPRARMGLAATPPATLLILPPCSWPVTTIT